MTDLFERVLHHIEGSETEIQNWETLDGLKAVEFQSFGPDRWIESVHINGRLMAIDCLAIILFTVRKSFDREQERRIVESWSAELRKALSGGEIQARDPVTLLPLETLPSGWEWLLPMTDADKFIAARGMAWTFGEIASHLYKEFEQAIERRRFGPCLREEIKAPATQAEPEPVPTETINERNTRWLRRLEDEQRGPTKVSEASVHRLIAGEDKAKVDTVKKGIEAARKIREKGNREGNVSQLRQPKKGKPTLEAAWNPATRK
ncbi:MAG: hypothetical protein K9K38_06640 [Rhodoferax sp.]|nr:hypothetical protein [Rhodoferax sp.]